MINMDINDKIFIIAYAMAFGDATMRNAYPRRKGEESTEYRRRKQKVMDTSRDMVFNYIRDIFEDKKPDPVETIINICNKELSFTFKDAFLHVIV